ncbi:MAG: hypothetical protein DRR08_11450 [Candidatus Parabeggiatoa sp. nov. 2]|nr:MAG: hypothetical protein B6247_19450 [Beggiatoa sp. 4572_84]RKZ60389.1 MAG: hypothetical protein DRR08_11450 [Gammaproteobacteria bacterium]
MFYNEEGNNTLKKKANHNPEGELIINKAPTPKGLNTNSHRWNLWKKGKDEPTLKGLNMNSHR